MYEMQKLLSILKQIAASYFTPNNSISRGKQMLSHSVFYFLPKYQNITWGVGVEANATFYCT